MTPAQPPFPTDCRLPFQPEIGSHTSISISESLEGVSVAATRQKDRRWMKRSATDAPSAFAPGGGNAPDAITCARVIVAFESENPAKDSHEAARADAMQTKPSIVAKETTKKKPRQH